MLDQATIDRIQAIVKARGWNKGWSAGGCYLHLEAAEFIESLRGKHGDPASEAADVLVALGAMLGWHGITAAQVEAELDSTLGKLEARKIGRDGDD